MKQTNEKTNNWKPFGVVAEELAQRVRKLCPNHCDPHRFHEEKSDIAFELSKLARRVTV